MKKVLKSFSTAHEAVTWVSLNRIEGVSIENTSTLKSFGYGRIPSGNYHVIKSERGAPSADFLSPHDADSDAFDEAEARVADTEGDLEERNTLLSQMGPLTRYAGEVLHAASLAEEDGDDLAFDAADQHIRDTVEYHANRFGIKDPAEIDRLHEIVGGEQFMGRKSIIRDIVSEVLKSMGIQKKNTKLASTARELSNRFNELSQEQALKSVVESVVRGVLKDIQAPYVGQPDPNVTFDDDENAITFRKPPTGSVATTPATGSKVKVQGNRGNENPEDFKDYT